MPWKISQIPKAAKTREHEALPKAHRHPLRRQKKQNKPKDTTQNPAANNPTPTIALEATLGVAAEPRGLGANDGLFDCGDRLYWRSRNLACHSRRQRYLGRIRDAAEKQAGAAQKIAYASKRNADAAQRFADTAALINGGIGDAVKKLDARRRAARRTAGTAGEALVSKAQIRPWLGIVDVCSSYPRRVWLAHESLEVKLQDWSISGARRDYEIRILWDIPSGGGFLRFCQTLHIG